MLVKVTINPFEMIDTKSVPKIKGTIKIALKCFVKEGNVSYLSGESAKFRNNHFTVSLCSKSTIKIRLGLHLSGRFVSSRIQIPQPSIYSIPSFSYLQKSANNMDIPDFKQFKVHIPETGNYFDVLQALRGYYAYNHDRIIAHHEKGSMGHYVSYPCDWRSVMSPIEFEAWSAIRCKGRIPLYPQFPAGKYFLDFGNPYFKIGLELDGKGYHEKAKDLHRDEELHELGWKIFRITGSEMVKSNFEDGNSLFDSSDYYEQENDFQKLKDWIFNTGDGIIEALKVQYFGGGIHMPEQFHDRFRAWCNHSLNNHTLIPE